ncbi:hypothetical protein SERLA73DRAFT_157197 [Serpula lacrymans var. lacrymans S7.3]|uniref:Uncharacterized protein n=1 Tax=Serpula lacrymans var. lacrymans (strain S7.3) TaxID=936435 RepID=F8QHX1_SERL3|nr:hypothetical protein SERLA73DRAFT_157197 [Serpula lacrymans var. lacrymans S7.3]
MGIYQSIYCNGSSWMDPPQNLICQQHYQKEYARKGWPFYEPMLQILGLHAKDSHAFQGTTAPIDPAFAKLSMAERRGADEGDYGEEEEKKEDEEGNQEDKQAGGSIDVKDGTDYQMDVDKDGAESPSHSEVMVILQPGATTSQSPSKAGSASKHKCSALDGKHAELFVADSCTTSHGSGVQALTATIAKCALY